MYIGIEGGGSSASGIGVNSQGQVVAPLKFLGQGVNPHLCGFKTAAERIASLALDLLNGEPCDGLGITGSGLESPENQDQLLLELRPLLDFPVHYICNDTVGAAACASLNEFGVIIAGTGSCGRVVSFSDPNQLYLASVGGWGHLLMEAPCGWSVAQQFVVSIIRHYDGLLTLYSNLDESTVSESAFTNCRDIILDFFEISSLKQLLSVFYCRTWEEQKQSKARIAALTKTIADIARNGNPVAAAAFYCAGVQLADLINPLCIQWGVENPQFLMVGSLFKSYDLLREGYMTRLAQLSPSHKPSLFITENPPSFGAAMLAAVQQNPTLRSVLGSSNLEKLE